LPHPRPAARPGPGRARRGRRRQFLGGKDDPDQKGGVTIRRQDDEGKIVFEAELTGIDYKVLREEGRWVRVRDRGEEGWVAKADVVRLEDAVDYFTDRIRTNPSDGSAYSSRAVAWRLKGELDIAIKDNDEAIRLYPKQAASWINRGLAWGAKKEYDKAIQDYDEAIRLDPKFADPFNGRAWLLATCPNGKYRDGKKAIEAAKGACELTDWKNWHHTDTLAAAFAEAGNFEKAVAEQEKALADKSLDKDDRAKAEKRLALYREKKPYRDED
jgi:tetratricopeptide (TPR) repeat protein